MSGSGTMPGFDGNGSEDLVVGSVTGVRWFRLSSSPYSATVPLFGTYKPWMSGENKAVCLNDGQRMDGECHNRSDIPDEKCGCGFWAYWKLEHAPLCSGNGLAVGVIEGYGPTLLGDKGFRCAKARIVGLHLIPMRHAMYEKWYEAAERAIGQFYKVPMYATEQMLLHEHPLTTEYLPEDAPPPDQGGGAGGWQLANPGFGTNISWGQGSSLYAQGGGGAGGYTQGGVGGTSVSWGTYYIRAQYSQSGYVPGPAISGAPDLTAMMKDITTGLNNAGNMMSDMISAALKAVRRHRNTK